MTENSFNLTVIWRNPEPHREATYPRTWILQPQSGSALKLHVGHDAGSQPHVLDKGAA
jgi:hypothetical protein